MNYSSIFSIPPRNEYDLSLLEKKTHQILLKTLDINLTKKRANKLRDITCVLAGFPNGYQQLQSFWTSQTLPSSYQAFVQLIIAEQRTIEHIDSPGHQAVSTLSNEVCFKKLMRHTMQRSPDVICMGTLHTQFQMEAAQKASDAGFTTIATIEANTESNAAERLYSLGFCNESWSKLRLVPCDAIAALGHHS